MNNDVKCSICARRGVQDQRATKYLFVHPEKYEYKVFYCESCDFRWLHPLPDIESIYTASYFDCPNYNYDTVASDLAPCFHENAVRFKEISPGNEILDIGCATGEFLEALRDVGLNALGVDISNHAIDIAKRKKIQVVQGDIFSNFFESRKFDGIHMNHVLEHVPDPVNYIQKIKGLLNRKGVLYIEVPLQFVGWLERIKRCYQAEELPELYKVHHNSFYTAKSLKILLERNNFEIISLTTFRSCSRSNRMYSLRFMLLKMVLWLADLTFKKGDVISVWAQKTEKEDR